MSVKGKYRNTKFAKLFKLIYNSYYFYGTLSLITLLRTLSWVGTKKNKEIRNRREND